MTPPCHLTIWRRSAYGLCHFAVTLASLRRFVALHRFPSSLRLCFPRMASHRSGSSSPSSGDHHNNETAGASCWSPCTWHMDGNFGLRAEDAAPRSFAPCDSGRPNRVRTRRKVRLAGPALCQMLCNSAEEPTQASTTKPVRSALRQHAVILPASRLASHRIAPRAASASPGTAFAPPFWCLRPAWSYAPGHTYGNRTPATRGEAFWSCPLPVAQQPRGGADPNLNKRTCSLRATPACSPIASLVLCI